MIYRNMTNSEYHSSPGLSSSQLKDLITDPQIFHKKWVTKEIEREELSAFDIGTFFHTAILEPEKLDSECVVFKGVRRGAVWDAFKKDNLNKVIITDSEYQKAKNLIDGVRNSPKAMSLLKLGESEISCFIEILVKDGDIFHLSSKSTLYKLDIVRGWVEYLTNVKSVEGAVLIRIKARADLLGVNFILDLKSMSGNVRDTYGIKKRISDYCYEMSAAFYLDIFNAMTPGKYDNFYWTFATKDLPDSKTYLASMQNISIGRAKWCHAIKEYVKWSTKKWNFEDEIGVIEPLQFEKEWLELKEGDIL